MKFVVTLIMLFVCTAASLATGVSGDVVHSIELMALAVLLASTLKVVE